MIFAAGVWDHGRCLLLANCHPHELRADHPCHLQLLALCHAFLAFLEEGLRAMAIMEGVHLARINAWYRRVA
jgi:hypothetical protein